MIAEHSPVAPKTTPATSIRQDSSGYSSSTAETPKSIDSNTEIGRSTSASLSRKNSSDTELLFGDKPAEYYRNKYAYSTYTSQGKSSDVDVMFGGNSSSAAETGSRDYGYKSNSSIEGISNPVFRESFESSSGAISKRRSRDSDDDDFDLK